MHRLFRLLIYQFNLRSTFCSRNGFIETFVPFQGFIRCKRLKMLMIGCGERVYRMLSNDFQHHIKKYDRSDSFPIQIIDTTNNKRHELRKF